MDFVFFKMPTFDSIDCFLFGYGEDGNRFHTNRKGPGADCPMKSAPPFVSSETAPHLSEEGQPKNAGE